MNQRNHQRFLLLIPVEVSLENRRLQGTSRNLSLGGMFIDCEEQVPFGARIELRFALDGLERPVETRAIVRWVDPRGGFGVQFEGLRAVEVWALLRLASRLQVASGA